MQEPSLKFFGQCFISGCYIGFGAQLAVVISASMPGITEEGVILLGCGPLKAGCHLTLNLPSPSPQKKQTNKHGHPQKKTDPGESRVEEADLRLFVPGELGSHHAHGGHPLHWSCGRLSGCFLGEEGLPAWRFALLGLVLGGQSARIILLCQLHPLVRVAGREHPTKLPCNR